MGVVALAIVTMLYLVTACDYWEKDDSGMALAFFCLCSS
jgi:hypothetical protein